MVELSNSLDAVFHSLADSTRRDILKRVAKKELSISTLAKPYTVSFAAIAKHVSVLEKAKLIQKRRLGKEQLISAVPKTISSTLAYLAYYEKIWEPRLTALEQHLHNNP